MANHRQEFEKTVAQIEELVGNVKRTGHVDQVQSVAALVFEQFQYKDRSYETWDGQNQPFNGLVVRDRKNDWWAKNCGPTQTPALNEIELFARYGLTIQALINEVKALGGFTWL